MNNKESDKPLSDEVHRHRDWLCHVEIYVQLDSNDDNTDEIHVLSCKHDASFQVLADQLFDLAFSGDAIVVLPDIIGEAALDHPIEPEELAASLRLMDTTTIEDIHTGMQHDTVIDLSFSKANVSAMQLFCAYEKQSGIHLDPVLCGLGKQVFDPLSGRFRGISNKFFVQVSDNDAVAGGSEIMRIQSDSTGVFTITGLYNYEAGAGSLSGHIRSVVGQNATSAVLRFTLALDYAKHRLSLEDLSIEPSGSPI